MEGEASLAEANADLDAKKKVWVDLHAQLTQAKDSTAAAAKITASKMAAMRAARTKVWRAKEVVAEREHEVRIAKPAAKRGKHATQAASEAYASWGRKVPLLAEQAESAKRSADSPIPADPPVHNRYDGLTPGNKPSAMANLLLSASWAGT